MRNGCLRTPNLPLAEVQRHLLDEPPNKKAGIGSVWRFFHRHGISLKSGLSRLANAMTVKRVATTRAIAAPSSYLLSV
jgi:hypothetical protein